MTVSTRTTFTSSEGVSTRIAPSVDAWLDEMQLACDSPDTIHKAISAFDSSREQYARDVAMAQLFNISLDHVEKHYASCLLQAAQIINTALDNKYPTPRTANRVRATYRRSY